MSRNDGTYPSYVKVDVNPDEPPRNWSKGCRRCSSCGKNFPNVAVFSPSPCHNVVAGIVATGEPDMSWSQAVHDLLHAKFKKYYERWNEGTSDEELYWAVARQPVSEEEVARGLADIEEFISHALTDQG